MNHAIHSRRDNALAMLMQASLATIFAVSAAHAAVTTCMVTGNADNPSTSSDAVDATTASGTLRDCVLAANLLTGSIGRPTVSGMTIVFDPSLSGATIHLGNDLPLLFNNIRVDASALPNPVAIDGGSAHRIFVVSGLPSIPISGKPDGDGAQAVAVTLTNLSLQHGLARGGDATHGGGGLGAGGALFVNKSATVTLNAVSFVGNAAQGGGGVGTGGHGGGGGMGAGTSGFNGGGGLGSVSLSNAGAGIGTGGTVGGASGGWGGQGAGQLSSVQGFNPLDFDVDGGSGAGGSGLIGGGGGVIDGNGGFGGGATTNGNGGFGGGGGAGVGAVAVAGNGGFGGGGGSGFSIVGSGSGGFGAGGGNGPGVGGVGGAADAGGGAGFGGAIFVRAGGTLIMQNNGTSASINGGSVIAGTGLTPGSAAGSALFLMSGSTMTFDVAGAYTIAGALADDSTSSLPAGQSYTPGNGAGAPIVKQGAGTLILSGTSTFAGATTVDAGILRVTSPGNIKASLVTVATPGTLSGDGSIFGIDSFGVLAPATPGNPQGTLSVNGSMRLEPGALTCFHASGASNAVSDLNIAGLATLDGVARIDFIGAPAVGTSYVLLNAGSITGAFTGFETNMPNLDGVFVYTSTAVTFTVSASDVLFADGFEQSVSDSSCVAAFTN